ncbi:hypothetical protein U91I_03765 [alpha proteobacterium U9-1i]|nr:hypothetical protein U91I_03765 [alpha proteobacterium U9-1i]
MGAVGRILGILVVIVLVAVGAAFFVLPSQATRTQTFTVERPASSVFARLASTPAGTVIAEGVTQNEVTSAADNVVVANVAYAEGGTGTATYTVSEEGEGSRVELALAKDLGANPLNRFGAITGAGVGPLAEAAATTVTADLTALPAASFVGLQYTVVNVEARPFFYVQNCSPQDAAAIKEVVAQSLLALRPIMARHNLREAGPPVAVETSWDEANNQYCFQIGLPYTGTPPRVLAVGAAGQTPAGQAIRVDYTGTEEDVIPTYDRMEALIAAARLTQGRSFEVYNDDATQAQGSVNREIYYLVEGDTARLAQLAPAAAATPAAAPAADPAAAPAAPAPEQPATPAAPASAPTPAPATP